MCGSDHPGEFKEKGAAIVSLVDRVAAKKFPNKEFGNCCPLVSVGFLHVSTRQSNETSLDFRVYQHGREAIVKQLHSIEMYINDISGEGS